MAARGYDDVVWGMDVCVAGCGALATCFWEGRAVCFDCADLVLDRLTAISIWPEAREILPPLSDVIRRPWWLS